MVYPKHADAHFLENTQIETPPKSEDSNSPDSNWVVPLYMLKIANTSSQIEICRFPRLREIFVKNHKKKRTYSFQYVNLEHQLSLSDNFHFAFFSKIFGQKFTSKVGFAQPLGRSQAVPGGPRRDSTQPQEIAFPLKPGIRV